MNLPAGCDALDGIRMAVISDLHLGCATPPGWLEETLRRIKEARADIILLDGDLSDGRPEDRRSDLARLGTLEAPFGVWAVPGNHEYYVDYAGIMAALPDSVHVLANSHARLRTSLGTFVLAGVTDRKARARGLPGPDIEKALFFSCPTVRQAGAETRPVASSFRSAGIRTAASLSGTAFS